jgi:hypothetical protein
MSVGQVPDQPVRGAKSLAGDCSGAGACSRCPRCDGRLYERRFLRMSAFRRAVYCSDAFHEPAPLAQQGEPK